MRINKSKIAGVLGAGSVFLLSVSPAFAHVAVKPSEVGMAAFETFTVGVPNEKEVATTALRLVIPQGLEHVSANVKPGWRISMKHGEAAEPHDSTQAGHSDEPVVEISWTGGSIPAGLRDDFLFSAKSPAAETTLLWKAYQTYADGTVVSWDIEPNQEQPKDTEGNPDYSKSGPASQTKVVNDLITPNTSVQAAVGKTSRTTTVFSVGALLLSLFAIGMQLNRKK